MNPDPSELIDHLRHRLREGPPGHDRFMELSGYQRPDIADVIRQQPPPKESAVLVLLYPHESELRTLLMLRPDYDGVHSGQVAFPGGHREPHDVDLRHTALREFTEETGASHAGFEVLGEMTRVYIPPSRTLVTPVLAYAGALGPTSPDPHEVAALIPVSVQHLMRHDILKHRMQYIAMLGREVEVPYWDVAGHAVWGATALMIAELRELLQGLR